jgi:hypothetical protein
MALLMICLALITGMDTSMTAEEKQTRACNDFCNGVESRISQHVSACQDITSTSATGGNICSSNHGMSDLEDRS